MKKIPALLMIAAMILFCLPAPAEEAETAGLSVTKAPDFGSCLRTFMEACGTAAVSGEPEQVEFDAESFAFDTRTSLDVNAAAVREAAKKLFSDLLNDEAVTGMLQSVPGFHPDNVMKAIEEALPEDQLPDVAADMYTNSDGSGSCYVVSEATRPGADMPAFRFDMLSPDAGTVTMGLQAFESGARINLTCDRTSFVMEYFRDDRYYALKTGTEENGAMHMDMYVLDAKEPALSMTVSAPAETDMPGD